MQEVTPGAFQPACTDWLGCSLHSSHKDSSLIPFSDRLQFFIATLPITCTWLLIQHWTPELLDIAIAGFAALIPLSQQLHCWTHMRRSEVPAQITWLQDHGVLVSLHTHQAHHKEPHDSNFATVSGWWNPVLDARHGWFWHGMASLILAVTGVQPRCWQVSQDSKA